MFSWIKIVVIAKPLLSLLILSSFSLLFQNTPTHTYMFQYMPESKPTTAAEWNNYHTYSWCWSLPINSTWIYHIKQNKWNHGDRIIKYGIVDRLNCILSSLFQLPLARSIAVFSTGFQFHSIPFLNTVCPLCTTLIFIHALCSRSSPRSVFSLSHLLTVFILIIFLLENHNR